MLGTNQITKFQWYQWSRRFSSQTTHFGFQTIKTEDKKPKVAQVFHGVAEKYDQMNDAMSMGMHRWWKDVFVDMIQPRGAIRILDVAGGTGDIAFRMAKEMQGQGEIVVCDINSSMLSVGQDRAKQKGLEANLEWKEGDAEELEFESDSFDLYTIAFGIRNVTNIEKALSEAYRVLKSGGRLAVLEFSRVENPILSSVYDAYSFNVIPQLGQCIANDKDSYQYLVESIRQFPVQEEFKRMIETVGFQHVQYTNLTGGVVAVHSGFKL